MRFPDEKKGDIERCCEVVKKELSNYDINAEKKLLIEITYRIMGISGSKGGDYSSKIIQAFAEEYIPRNLIGHNELEELRRKVE